jgi:hypothetical protein
MVQRTGIGTFTTFVLDAGSRITFRGRAVDPGFGSALASAWTAATTTATTTTTTSAELREAQRLAESGWTVESLALLEKLEAKAPNDARIQRSLGMVLARLGRDADARVHSLRYLELAPNAADSDAVREILQSPAAGAKPR